ncbi:MAG: hypothetical protein V2I97_04005 [Desulfococcaceae bacterium]|nr:hypothetical protein [Desulfococcaceae bacterium]
MENIISFGDILEAASSLPVDQQLSLVNILQHRIAAKHREDICRSVLEARGEYHRGASVAATADDIMDDILS